MHRRAALAVVVLALAGCGPSGEDDAVAACRTAVLAELGDGAEFGGDVVNDTDDVLSVEGIAVQDALTSEWACIVLPSGALHEVIRLQDGTL